MAPASKITAEKRLHANLTNKNHYYVPQDNPNLLFCKACETPVDHSRPKSIVDHLTTGKHEKALKRKQTRDLMNRRQGTIEGAISASIVRNDLAQDFVAMMAEADVPIHKTEKIKPFLRKHCRAAGAIPSSDALRQYHLPKVYEQHLEKLRADIRDKKVYIAADETTDERGESVLNIIVGR